MKSVNFYKSFSKIAFLLLLFFLCISNSYSISNDTILPLEKRDYYSQIFSSEESKQIEKANKKTEKAEKYFSVYTEANKKYEEFKKYSSIVDNQAKKKKALKNAEKSNKKALKNGFKAVEYFSDANQTIYNIYSNKLNSFTKDSINQLLFDTLSNIYTNKFDTSKIIRTTAFSLEENKKLEKYFESYNIQNKSINIQEFTFGLFFADSVIIDSAKTFLSESKCFIEDKNYISESDKNLYKSKKEEIFNKIGLTNTENTLYIEIDKKNLKGKSYEEQSEQCFCKSIKLKEQAENEKNFVLKKKNLSEIENMTKAAYEYLSYSSEEYYNSNLILYNLYASKIQEVRPTDSSEISIKGMEYEELADNYLLESEILFDKYITNNDFEKRYSGLMQSNEYLLIAIQSIENAFCKYLNLQITDIIDNKRFITEEEIAEFFNENKEIDTLKNQSNIIDIQTDTIKTEKETEKNEVVENNKTQEQNKENNISDNTENKKDNSKFIYESSWIYTSKNPELTRYKTKDGIIFKIQVGLLKDLLPISEYQNFEPITVDKFENNDFKRILIGEYLTNEAAEYALEKIKEDYKDAYIVGFEDGKRISYEDAIEKMIKWQNYPITIEKEKAKIDGNEYVKEEKTIIVDENKETIVENKTETKTEVEDKKTDTKETEKSEENSKFIQGKDIESVKTLVYLIQLGTYQLPQTSEDLKNLKNIYTIKTKEDLTRYMLGLYYEIETAEKKLKEVKNLGFSDAYITSFNEGKEVDLKEAIKIEEAVESLNKVIYKVQIAAFVLELADAEFYEKYPNLKGKYQISSYKTTNDLIAYAVGACESYSQAEKISQELSKLGFSDNYIVAFKGVEKISIADAKKITEK